MKHYELTCLVSPQLSEEEIKDFQEKISSFAREQGGILTSFNNKNAIKRKLGYPIKTKGRPRLIVKEAYLAILSFSLEPAKIVELDKKLKSETQIIRYLLLTKTPPKSKIEVPKILPKAQEARTKGKPGEVKVELKEIEKKLEEILKE